MANEHIFGSVPGGPPLPNALKSRKKPGPKPKAKHVDKPSPEPGHCPECQQPSTPLSFELCKELVKSSRDRQTETEAEQRGKAAEVDLLYLAARFDGFCSLVCWRKNQ